MQTLKGQHYQGTAIQAPSVNKAVIDVPFKVETILKGSLDLISSPSPFVKIQIMCGKVCLRRKGKTLLGIVNTLLILYS